MSRRIVSCLLLDGRREAMPKTDPTVQVSSPKWLNVWEFERNGKRVRVAVEVYDKESLERREVVHPRDFIERLGEWPEGTGFDIYVEELDAAS